MEEDAAAAGSGSVVADCKSLVVAATSAVGCGSTAASGGSSCVDRETGGLAKSLAADHKSQIAAPAPTNAVRATEKEFRKELAAGFRLDIIESLKDGD